MVQEAADRAIFSGYATNGSPNRQRIPAAQAMPYLPPPRTFITPCRTKAGVTPCVSLVDRPTGASSGPAWLPVDELAGMPLSYTVQSTGRSAGAKICEPQQERKRNTDTEDAQGFGTNSRNMGRDGKTMTAHFR
jgi:hypothetical protein